MGNGANENLGGVMDIKTTKSHKGNKDFVIGKIRGLIATRRWKAIVSDKMIVDQIENTIVDYDEITLEKANKK